MSEVEPDERLLARAGEVMSGVQSGQIVGIMCVCFMANGSINVQVAGEQPLVVRLGALVVAGDAIKVLEGQQQNEREKLANWGPGGNA